MTGSPSRFRQLIRRTLAGTLPRRWLLVDGPVESRQVCLTFDDGPHPEHTPRLLDALHSVAIPATFFVVGREAEHHPELVHRMVTEGHVVGHHSFTHSNPFETSAAKLRDEICQTRALLTPILGAPPHLFRPPHGKLTSGKLWKLWRQGQTVVLWNTDPRDFAAPTAADVDRWFYDHPLRGGDIVLLHDNVPHAASIIPSLVAEARARGLSFTTVDQWV